MSSSTLPQPSAIPDSTPSDWVKPRRRKHQRACELCKRRKLGCDASEKPNNCCSRCISSGADCIYIPRVKLKRPTYRYVRELEVRVFALEKVLLRLHTGPNTHLLEELDKEQDDSLPFGASSGSFAPRAPRLSSDEDSGDAESLDSSEDEREQTRFRYHGKSSNASLIRTIVDLKSEHSSVPLEFPSGTGDVHPFTSHVDVPYTKFPSAEHLEKLIDAYFCNVNVYLPLLHRKTFQDNVDEGLHFHDESFGAVVLLVAAVGSTWVEDRPPAPGIQWFDQVMSASWFIFRRPRLYDLQACALAIVYMNATHSSKNGWAILCLGIRMAQDVGAHRKKMYSGTPTVELELWKRAFWVLVALDWSASFGMGRPCAINEEDFDVDLIIECDDEYWSNPDPAFSFRQPEGKPSKVAFFNCMVRLLKIQAFAARTIYTINKSKLLFGFVGSEWKQDIVAELDSALNKWKDRVPSHLLWDPDRKDPLFFDQSATLYASFYQLQIAVHRQFIPSPRTRDRGKGKGALSPSALPSLAICTHAARSCVRVLAAQVRPARPSPPRGALLHPLQMPLMTVCIVLLLNLWSGSRSEREAREIRADLETCLGILKGREKLDHGARQLRAVLNALISSTGDSPSSSTAPASTAEPRITATSGAFDLSSLILATMENLRISLAGDNADGDTDMPAPRTDNALTTDIFRDMARIMKWTGCLDESPGGPCAPAPDPEDYAETVAQSSTSSELLRGFALDSYVGENVGVSDASVNGKTGPSTSMFVAGLDDPIWSIADMVMVDEPWAAAPQGLFPPQPFLPGAAPLDDDDASGPQQGADISQWLVDAPASQDGLDNGALWSLWPTGVNDGDEWDRFVESFLGGSAESADHPFSFALRGTPTASSSSNGPAPFAHSHPSTSGGF